MKKEYLLYIIIGFFILSYVLDAVVNPLNIKLVTPYQYFTPANLITYAFTTTSIVLKAVALLLSPIVILDFIGAKATTKGISLLVLSGLLQLYALQDIATGSLVVPLEWSLAFTLSGLLLLIPTIIFFIIGSIQNVHHKLTGKTHPPVPEPNETHHKPDTLQKLHPHES